MGIYRQDTTVNKGLKAITVMYEGKRQYELSNHLGNVLTVINDRRTYTLTGSIRTYDAVVLSAQDYYPFGMGIDARSFSSTTSYRYGFNGQEVDNEIGNGLYTAEYWEYDAKLGRRWNIDPKLNTWESSYATLGNNPILNQDIKGDFWISDHWKIDLKAKVKAHGVFLGFFRWFPTIGTTLYKELWPPKMHDNDLHLDNKKNDFMKQFLEKGNYMTMDSHTLQDFYSHSNYVEIMKENGIADKDIVTFDKLDPKSDIYKQVMSKIQTTSHPDELKDPKENGHDGAIAGGYEKLANGAEPPLKSDKFMAKDANGQGREEDVIIQAGNPPYRGFKHPFHELAKRLALEATISKETREKQNKKEKKEIKAAAGSRRTN